MSWAAIPAISTVPIPLVLVTLLQRHLREHGTAPDGRPFRCATGGMLSENVYGWAWHACTNVLGSERPVGCQS